MTRIWEMLALRMWLKQHVTSGILCEFGIAQNETELILIS